MAAVMSLPADGFALPAAPDHLCIVASCQGALKIVTPLPCNKACP